MGQLGQSQRRQQQQRARQRQRQREHGCKRGTQCTLPSFTTFVTFLVLRFCGPDKSSVHKVLEDFQSLKGEGLEEINWDTDPLALPLSYICRDDCFFILFKTDELLRSFAVAALGRAGRDFQFSLVGLIRAPISRLIGQAAAFKQGGVSVPIRDLSCWEYSFKGRGTVKQGTVEQQLEQLKLSYRTAPCRLRTRETDDLISWAVAVFPEPVNAVCEPVLQCGIRAAAEGKTLLLPAHPIAYNCNRRAALLASHF